MDLNSSATWNHKKIRLYKTNHLVFTNHPLQQPIGYIHMLKEQYLLVLC
jgi:hypothetical protein